jgi:hypothetical protein
MKTSVSQVNTETAPQAVRQPTRFASRRRKSISHKHDGIPAAIIEGSSDGTPSATDPGVTYGSDRKVEREK